MAIVQEYARIYVVGFQKRGLPHAHIVIIAAEEGKPRTRELIDKFVSAEVPDKIVNPDLHETVMTWMMHGPCGPANPDSPLGGAVEPLPQTYDCHINVKVCTTIGAITYLYKYVYKGSDRTVLTIEAVRDPSEPRSEPNEILLFLNARYTSPVEAAMCILTYEIQRKTHAVTTPTVQLEGGQMVVFQPNDDPDRVLGRAGFTTSTGFFELCASLEPENMIARTMLYQEIPKEFSWDAKGKVCARRKKYQAAIGRLIHVSPMDIERFYLRLLLCHRKGPTSFENLRTMDSVIHPTFQAPAMHSGFLENDQEWIALSDVRGLWDKFYDELARDFAYKYRNLEGQTKQDMITFHTLKSLNDLLQIIGQAVTGFDLPQPSDYPHWFSTRYWKNNLTRRELKDTTIRHGSLPARCPEQRRRPSGKTVVLSGDFRQILPVVVRRTPVQTIDACLKSSHLWSHFRQVYLTENMRVRVAHRAETAAELAVFSDFLLQVGEGRQEVNRQLGRDYMKLPRSILIDDPSEEEVNEEEVIALGAISSGLKRLIDGMYPDVNKQAMATDEYFANRTILTTTNVMVHRINDAVAAKFDGNAHQYRSIDKLQYDDDWNFIEPEILNSVNINGAPPHKLTLKKGAPIVLMRNLNHDLVLCNGTRLRAVELKSNVIHAKIMTGERRGQDVLIPRIVFIRGGNDASFPYPLRRKPFPVQAAFAMTINKA
ncbi:unnamed protein product [Phytophthora fragariaefolia]|uniref:ATP-dependent DNA helicase n=1 Tax=Phytophthora fragariaefolia TaxID=1490495 RepID=A0A9W6XCC4_9STRA|nr:unnamed protein product [Phytophthora fragariaefolia]